MKATSAPTLVRKLEALNEAIAAEADVLVKLDLVQERIELRKAIAAEARTN